MTNIDCKKNKLIKIAKGNIFGFIFGLIVTSGISVAAVSHFYKSEEIIYKKNDNTGANVKGALDELYDIALNGDATPGDIVSGKTAMVQGKKIVGTLKSKELTIIANIGNIIIKSDSIPSYSYDIKKLTDKYDSLDKNNFIISMNGFYGNTASNTWADVSCYIGKSYDASTGILKISTSYFTSAGGYQGAFYGVIIYMI